MAERAQADQDIELGRGLRNQMTQRAGEHFVELPEPKDEREFYVFVDLGTGANALPGYWIAPRSWVQNMIYDHKQAWLKKRGRSKARNSDSKHSGMK